MIQDVGTATRSAHHRATVVLVLLLLGIALHSIGAFSDCLQIGLLDAYASHRPVAAGKAASNDARQAMISGLKQLCFYGTAIAFLAWMYKAHKNLPLLGAKSLEYSPGWAIGGFLVPVLSFVRPFSVMSEIWRASDPNREADQSWKWENPPVVLRWWWGLFVVKLILTKLTGFHMFGNDAAGAIGRLIHESYLLLACDLSDIPAAIAAMMTIWAVDARQASGLNRLLTAAVNEPILPELPA